MICTAWGQRGAARRRVAVLLDPLPRTDNARYRRSCMISFIINARIAVRIRSAVGPSAEYMELRTQSARNSRRINPSN